MFFWVFNNFNGSWRKDRYKSKDAAQNRADKIEGGETRVWGPTYESDPERAFSEFRDEEIRQL